MEGTFKLTVHGRKTRVRNAVVNEGLDSILEVMFRGGATFDNWYFGLIDNAGFTGITAQDTLASHAGWVELADYTGDRPEWLPIDIGNQTILNDVPVIFDMTATVTIRGMFIASATTDFGLLWSTALLTTPLDVVLGDEVRGQYSLRARNR